MNIQVTLDPIEMLETIDKNILWNYFKDTITAKEKEEVGESLYSSDSDTLWKALELKIEEERKEVATFIISKIENKDLLREIDTEEIKDYIKEYTQYYISDDVGELMEIIDKSDGMEEVFDHIEIRYMK